MSAEGALYQRGDLVFLSGNIAITNVMRFVERRIKHTSTYCYSFSSIHDFIY